MENPIDPGNLAIQLWIFGCSVENLRELIEIAAVESEDILRDSLFSFHVNAII
jgi:hypothetical protein